MVLWHRAMHTLGVEFLSSIRLWHSATIELFASPSRMKIALEQMIAYLSNAPLNFLQA
jgi:hypothetical protein